VAAERRHLLPTLALALLAGCGVGPTRDGAPAQPIDLTRVADAVPRSEPPSRYGNPASYRVDGQRYRVLDSSKGYVERGIASWYGTKFHGRRTSNGETYDMYGMTAAHRSLPLPTYVRVTNLANGRTAVVRVNDRGPFHSDRIIDLSYAAAGKIGLLGTGTAQVEVRAIDPDAPATRVAVAGEAVSVQPAAFAANATLAEPIPATALVPAPAAAVVPAPAAALVPAPAAAVVPAPAAAVVPVPAAAVVPVPAAAVVPAPAAVTPAPVPAVMTGGGPQRLYLQVGAFSERGNAEQLRERLARAGLASAAVHSHSDALFRVRLGPFASPDEAGAHAVRLTEIGLAPARVYLD
jgi:rare lipoprotein A